MSGTLFVLCAGMLFGGAAGAWFSAGEGASWLVHGIQLATGSMAMGALVSIAGSLLFGRNPIRWGMGVPVMVYLAGMLMALVTGRDGSVALLFGAPIFLGVTIAAGVLTAFLIDGVFGRQQGA